MKSKIDADGVRSQDRAFSAFLVRFDRKDLPRGRKEKGAVHLQSKVGSFCKGGVQTQRVRYKRKGLGGIQSQMKGGVKTQKHLCTAVREPTRGALLLCRGIDHLEEKSSVRR